MCVGGGGAETEEKEEKFATARAALLNPPPRNNTRTADRRLQVRGHQLPGPRRGRRGLRRRVLDREEQLGDQLGGQRVHPPRPRRLLRLHRPVSLRARPSQTPRCANLSSSSFFSDAEC